MEIKRKEITKIEHTLIVSEEEYKLLKYIFNKISPSDLSRCMNGYMSASEICDITNHSKENCLGSLLNQME